MSCLKWKVCLSSCCPGNLGNEALLVTRDDEVFALGSNGAGCLGQGDMHSSLQPKQIEPLCYKVCSFICENIYVMETS